MEGLPMCGAGSALPRARWDLAGRGELGSCLQAHTWGYCCWGELLLLPSLANKAALHFPPLVCGIIFLSPLLSGSPAVQLPTSQWGHPRRRELARHISAPGMGLVRAQRRGLAPRPPHSKCHQQAAIPAPGSVFLYSSLLNI